VKNSNQLSSRRDVSVGHILHYFKDLLYHAESMFLQNINSTQLSYVRRPCNLCPSNVIMTSHCIHFLTVISLIPDVFDNVCDKRNAIPDCIKHLVRLIA